MTKERFIELLTAEGYSKVLVEALWDERLTDVMDEHRVKQAAKMFVIYAKGN